MRHHRYRRWFLACVLVGLLASLGLNLLLFRFADQYYRQLNGTRLDPLGLNQFASAPNPRESVPADQPLVLFYGDSRAAEWSDPAVPGVSFANRGIGSQTSSQIWLRYATHVTPIAPDVLVVQMCINDLKTIPLFPQRKTAVIATCQQNINQIVQMARAQNITVVLTTIIPVGPFPIERRFLWSADIPLAIDEVNAFIRALDGSEGVIVLDAYALLVDEEERLAAAYRRDELHLNGQGYAVLNEALREMLLPLP